MPGANIRNLALLGHGGAGKTTLAEAMLFAAQAISRQGKVTDKNTVADFLDDERERGHSLNAAVVHFDWKGCTYQVLDAPGYPDFMDQALPCIDAADCALILVDAYDGVALNTRRHLNAARAQGIPCMIVVNRCDADNIDTARLQEQLAELCGTAAKPVTIPDAWGADFTEVRSIFGDAAELKEGFVEAAVEADDALMEKYLEAGEVSDDDLKKAIPIALKAGTLMPVFHVAAEKCVGVRKLLDYMNDFGPNPLNRLVKDTDGNEVACTEDGPMLGVCFKVMFDRQAGKIAFFRLYRGSLRSGDQAVVARTGDTIKVGNPMQYQGPNREDVPTGGAGDIVALAKVDEVEIGDTIHAPDSPVNVATAALPNPMVGLALTPKSRGDEAKIAKELTRIIGASACLTADRSRETNELVLRGLSTLAVDIALKRLAENGVEVDTATPKVAYLETITGKAEGHYRHKKQTGGAGQFGEVYLRVEPLPRGSEDPLEFVEEVVGGAISKPFLSAIEKGIRQKMTDGVMAGCKVIDIKVAVYDGKMHDVDSKEIAFIIAGRNAFAEAVKKAKPVLLEPVVDVEIEVPSKYMGDITGDLNSRRARIQGMDSSGDTQIIKAQAPLSEMQTYSTQLRSITAGEGSFTMDFSHYDVVPGNVAKDIVARFEAEKKADDDS